MQDRQTEQHLEVACRWIDSLLYRQVVRLRVHREQTPEEFRGLCIADAEVDQLLAAPVSAESSEERTGFVEGVAHTTAEETEAALAFPKSRLNQISARFSLDAFERRALILAVAPEVGLRYQTLFAYVQNDITRRVPTIDLIVKLLCGSRQEQWQARRHFSPQAPLFANLLLQFCGEPVGHAVTQLARPVRVVPRVVEFLLGQDSLDEDLADLAILVSNCLSSREFERAGELEHAGVANGRLAQLAASLGEGGVVVLRGRDGAGKLQAAQAVCGRLAKPLILCDLRSDAANERTPGAMLRRECKLLDAALYLQLGAAAVHKKRLHADLARTLAWQHIPIFLSIEDAQTPAPEIASEHWFGVEFRLPEVQSRRLLWERELQPHGLLPTELDQLAGEFRFTPGQIRAVARDARSIRILRNEGSVLSFEDLRQAAHNRCNARLRGLAQKVELLFDWDDLILPPRVLQQLHEIRSSVRLRHIVHARWGFDAKTGKDCGISVLFAGASGTGKTMAAGVLARSLGLELYKVDLSCVVSKYVGETEQNLRKIFDEAEHSSAVLFFDEADALFGKRSEVKDAQDRYANIEVAYLLQKMEQFPGLAVLATNLSRNIDVAFLRRLQHVVEFPFPDPAHRERIWRAMFPEQAPRGADVDFLFLSRQFELSGGNIRNAVTAGAFLAAEREEPISMEHLVRAVGREMQKLGKLPSKAEFQSHIDIISRQSSGRS